MDPVLAPPPRIRPPALAGHFYAANPTQLAAHVDQLLENARATQAATLREGLAEAPCPKVIIVPHAGHVYSGAMAALAYERLRPYRAQIRKIVMLGPTHRVAVRGIALAAASHFATPLGTVEVDTLGEAALADLPGVGAVPQAHAQEHDLEVHLPFIQRLWADAPLPRIVPLLVGAVPANFAAQILERLWGGNDTLILISTDLSHFHPYAEAQTIDQETCHFIQTFQAHITHEQACGATPLNGLLQLAQKKGLQIEALGHCNSGDTPAGNTPEGRQRVVGYASFALYEPAAAKPLSGELTPAQGQQLIKLARASLSQAVGLSAEAPVAPVDSGNFDAPGASFVTLNTQEGPLRGCIGSLQAHRPLQQDIAANAMAAALRDPRFPAVSAAEAPSLRVEVSVLTPPEPLRYANPAHALWQLQAGVHGVIFEATLNGRHYRSTFLPQVWEQLPDPRQFMAQLKRKAGLPADFWSDSVRLHVYRVQKFKEDRAA